MKSPFADCEAVLMQEERSLEFRKERFSYKASFYRCPVSKIDFTTTELDTHNLQQVYDQYRQKYNILSPEEMKALRKKYGLSAAKMSEILGLGTNQYRLYENGEMPSLAVGRYLRLLEDPAVLLQLLRNAKVQFSEAEYRKLFDKITHNS